MLGASSRLPKRLGQTIKTGRWHDRNGDGLELAISILKLLHRSLSDPGPTDRSRSLALSTFGLDEGYDLAELRTGSFPSPLADENIRALDTVSKRDGDVFRSID